MRTSSNEWYLTFMGPCIVNVFLSTTNKMQSYTIFFIVVIVLHVSSGFPAYHQELKNCTYSVGYLSDLFAATTNVDEWMSLTRNSGPVSRSSHFVVSLTRNLVLYLHLRFVFVSGRFLRNSFAKNLRTESQQDMMDSP